MFRARKLKDEQVVAMREHYAAASPKPSWHVLGELFGVSWKTAYRVCTGQVASHAGGPTIEQPGIQWADESLRNPPQRCKSCGGLVYLPCRLCSVRVLKFLDDL